MLTRQTQIQIIADWINAYEPDRVYSPDEFGGPLRDAWRAVQDVVFEGDGTEATYRQLCTARLKESLRDGQGQALLGRILSATPSAEIHYPNLFDVAANLRPVQWLWENWLPIGMLSMLAARPGTGKSLVALDFMRLIISGGAWPDGAAQPRPGAPCLYVDAENVPAILNERAEQWEQWGMDRRRVYPLLADDDDIIVSLADPKYADRLADMAHRLKPALIVVDSLRDVLPAGESDIADVRDVLALLSAIAGESASSVLVIHHLRKGQASQAALFDSIDLDQVSGSGYIGGRARCILGLTKPQSGAERDKNGPRKLEVVKTNLGAYPDDIGIEFAQTPPAGLRLIYGPPPRPYSEETDADRCAAWLLAFLEEAGEPVSPKEACDAAANEGYKRTTVYRGRDLLADQVIETGGHRSRNKTWQLATNADSASAEATDVDKL